MEVKNLQNSPLVLSAVYEQEEHSNDNGNNDITVTNCSENYTNSVKSTFSVDTSLIKKTTIVEQSKYFNCTQQAIKESFDEKDVAIKDVEALNELGLDVYDQDDLEEGIMAQVDEAMEREEEERLRRIREREIKSIDDDMRTTEEELIRLEKIINSFSKHNTASCFDDKIQLRAAISQKHNKMKQMRTLMARHKRLLVKLTSIAQVQSTDTDSGIVLDSSSLINTHKETQAEKQIRLGEMTPFGTVVHTSDKSLEDIESNSVPCTLNKMTDFEYFLADKDKLMNVNKKAHRKHKTHFESNSIDTKKVKMSLSYANKTKASSIISKAKMATLRDIYGKSMTQELIKLKNCAQSPGGDCKESVKKERVNSCSNIGAEVPLVSDAICGKLLKKKLAVSNRKRTRTTDSRSRDDGSLVFYEKRIKQYRYNELLRKQNEEPNEEDVVFDGGFKIPFPLWSKLYRYQKTCVKWLWELHSQEAGGIVGDEMGLGKTIQLIAFLGALRHSQLPSKTFRSTGLGACIIVCPATVMMQWVKEFHKWQPMFRVAILHSSGSFVTSEASLIQNIVKCNGVIITSYSSLVLHQVNLLKHNWHYVVLDEGHKIRNPDAQTSLCCKQFRTPHRLILSGSPIQNNLRELWSLIDFIFPGKLGTLPDFMQHFAVPITQGGYSNATEVQVQTAYKCACVLRDTINPYLLRRLKADVKTSLQLPNKNEQVLFCRLSEEQRDTYQQYLDSDECKSILGGKYKVFVGLTTLRKICNHPDISTGGPRVLVGDAVCEDDPTLQYGYYKRAGKMIVIEALLKIWRQQEHRVLLFSQSRAMLDILEYFVKERSYIYMRMDGGTSITSRHTLINKFNNDTSIFVFLLTTRVGGLGVNLTGADRVVIYDPDWNPSTDLQARERAWRIGQDKQVTIYRLLTTGTIEEKIYHRQIFKQFLTNRVLKDPKQRRFFKSNDLMELFTLSSKNKNDKSETSAIFAGTGSDVTVPRKVGRVKASKEVRGVNPNEKIRQMAKNLSRKIGKGTYSPGKGKTQEKGESGLKKENKKRNAKIEGEEIPNLVKQRPHKSNDDNNKVKVNRAKEKASNKAHDDYVLQRLFAKTGVEEALQHDTIINSSRSDYTLVESEADRVAQQAASALKKSRAHCNAAVSGIPTWTGTPLTKPRFGQKRNNKLVGVGEKRSRSDGAAIPLRRESMGKFRKSNMDSWEARPKSTPSKLFDGHKAGSCSINISNQSSMPSTVSSSDLLFRMRARNNLVSTAAVSDSILLDPSYKSDPEFSLITEIRDHIACRCRIDGQATTDEILTQFATLLPQADNAKFKAMLSQICTFEKMCNVGIWKLKPEFR